MILQNKHQEALEFLAEFKFLTSSQFVTLGLYKNRGGVTNALKQWGRSIEKNVIGLEPGIGRVEDVYYLTSYGKELLIGELMYEENKIKIPKRGASIAKKNYYHNKWMVNFHIGLSRWLKQNDSTKIFLNYDFDKIGTNRSSNKNQHVKSINTISIDGNSNNFIPDIITKFKISGRDYLFLFEQHNGDDTKRLYKQLAVHLKALTNGVVRKQYNFEKSHRVAVVCEKKSVKESILVRLRESEEFNNFHKFFIFKTNEELQDDFFNNWTQLDSKTVQFTSS